MTGCMNCLSNLDDRKRGMTYTEIRANRADYGSQYEILVALFYHSFLKEEHIAVDGGANAGLHALPMALKVRYGHLFCFEPNVKIGQELVNNLFDIGVLNRCSVHFQALGNETGTVEFLIDDAHPAVSHVRFEKSSELRAVEVPLVRLDDVIREHNVGFIKLDLEGADFRALQGGDRILQTSRPFVVFENSREWAAKCYGYSKDEFFAFFDRLGYRMFDLHGVELTPDSWLEDDIAFEFIAASGNDPRLQAALDLIARFWSTLDQRPVLDTWSECVMIARDPMKYLKNNGWR